MLTNAYETQVVQSLGVRIGPDLGAEAAGTSGSSCPFAAMLPASDGASGGAARPGQPEPAAVQWTAAAEARLANIPAFVRPMARTGIETFARERGVVAGGRDDPRRGPRLLRDVTRRSFSGGGRDKAPVH